MIRPFLAGVRAGTDADGHRSGILLLEWNREINIEWVILACIKKCPQIVTILGRN